MELYLIWLIIALVLLGTEMMLASVYLIAFLLGALTASALAFFGSPLTIQCTLGAIVIIAGVICAYFYRKKIALLNNKSSLDNIDEDQIVFVDNVLEDGTAKVKYRGAQWTAYKADGAPITKGQHKIEKIDGTRLVLK
ncbi:MAG: NfeD family protein [Succinivibrio sp.]|uniref:NfeD family protein n=1 Tax=Succinivibrio sp. TaxID=2053619 RepID=UPI002F95779C